MKPALLIAAAFLWQAGVLDAPGPAADPAHLRWQRAILLPTAAAGQACASLDAPVYAHSANAAANDLRLFANTGSPTALEVPFILNESEPQPVDSETASVRNLGARGGNIVFDLEMPHRAYSEVDLQLNAQNFLATATISGSDGRGGPATSLGSFTVFDLTQQRLGRSTALPLVESNFAELHITLQMNTLDGHALASPNPAIVTGASVPPSRQAQTLYATVARTTRIATDGHRSVARFDVPAHVPVERVAFEVAPSFAGNFLREVAISAATHGAGVEPTAPEIINGEISRVTRAASLPEVPALHHEALAVDATLGSTLNNAATITVAVDNGDDPALPIAAVDLQMRRRAICFDATPGYAYTLRYGDAALHAPVYDYARLFQPAVKPVAATLGPEQENPAFTPRADQRPYTERHPELMWIALLVVVLALGVTALQSVKRQGRKS